MRVAMLVTVVLLAACRRTPPADYYRNCGFDDGAGADGGAYARHQCSPGLTCSPASLTCLVLCDTAADCAAIQGGPHSASATCHGNNCEFLCDSDNDCPASLVCTNRHCGG